MMRKKKLSLLEQAVAAEKQLYIDKLSKVSRGAKNNLDVLSVLLPNYKPQPKQILFHNSKAYEKGLKGGYGSGKTIALCAEGIFLAYINRPITVVLASPSEDIIQETTLKTLKQLCKENDLQFDWTDKTGVFKIFFGSTDDECGHILLIGQGFFKGANIAALGIDEPFSQKKEHYENLIARVRNPKAKRRQIFWAGTAEPSIMEWGTEYFEKDSDTAQLFTITIPTTENKHLPKEYIADLTRKYDAKMREVYLEGKYIMLGQNRAYSSFDRKKNVMSLTSPYSLSLSGEGHGFDELILGFDFNVDPMSCAVIVLQNKIFYQIKEFSIHNSNTAELCAAVIAYLKNIPLTPFADTQGNAARGKGEKSIIITGDASGRRRGTRGYLSDYEIIRDEFTRAEIAFYFNVPVENPAVRDRVNFVNKLFESERHFIDESCMQTIKDRELVSWKENGDGFMIDKSKKHLTHLSDAADYVCWNNQILINAEEGEPSVSVAHRVKRF